MKADFHMHSLYSDGIYPPGEVLSRLMREGVTHFALTDHDTNRGIAEMKRLCSEDDMPVFLPGTEISCGGGGRTHILLYGGVDTPDIDAWMKQFASARVERAMRIVDLLRLQGVVLSDTAIERIKGCNAGRPHIAREMIAEGFVRDQKQAFDLYLNEGKCCFVPHQRKTASALLDEFRRFPVVPVLAHPFKIGLGGETAVLSMIESLIPHGLRGVEAFHPSANSRQARVLESFAREHGLLVTGGSDFHGEGEGHYGPGDMGSPWRHMEEDTRELLQAVEKKLLKC